MPQFDAVDRFFFALNGANLPLLEDVLDPAFVMVVPQKPARGFKGRLQELDNMRYLFESYPDFHVTVLRKVVDGPEVWTETTAVADGLEMAAVVIWTLDPGGARIVEGRYYSEPVERDAPRIDEFIASIGPDRGPE